MSADHEDLIDYEEEEETVVPTKAAPAVNGKDKKGSYVGVHSTGFRYGALLNDDTHINIAVTFC